MTWFLVRLALALAGASLGLRITSVLIGPRLNKYARLIASLIIGAALVVAVMQVSDGYQLHDLGLGLLVSLAPVGVYDLTKWWLRSRRIP